MLSPLPSWEAMVGMASSSTVRLLTMIPCRKTVVGMASAAMCLVAISVVRVPVVAIVVCILYGFGSGAR